MKKLLFLLLTLGMAVPVHAYVTTRKLVDGAIVQVRWPSISATTTTIFVSGNPGQGARITGDRTLIAATEAAFLAWSDAETTATFEFERGADTAVTTSFGYDGINMVKTNLTTQAYSSSGAGDALALTIASVSTTTGQILDADIIFNPNVNFSLSTTVPADQYDYQTVLTHEVGHLLGLDHSAMLNAVMFPRIAVGVSARVVSSDDILGVSTIYPNATFLARGSISGTVRLTSNATVYGAIVVALTMNGRIVAHGVSDTRGNFVIHGLEAGNYRLYAEPMDTPYSFADQSVLGTIYGSSAISTSFTSRFW